MAARRRRIEKLLGDFAAMRRTIVFRGVDFKTMPRITPAQWSVLMFIEERRELSLKDVAHALAITSSAATQLVDALVKNGYVVREVRAEDRRAISLVLSKKTGHIVKKMKKEATRRLDAIFAVLTNEEFKRYSTLTEKIVSNFTRKTSAST